MVFSREMLLDLNTKSMVISLIDISISWIFPQIYLWKMSAEFDDTSFLFSHERMNLFGVFYETNTLKFPYNTMRISLLVFFFGGRDRAKVDAYYYIRIQYQSNSVCVCVFFPEDAIVSEPNAILI